jgi:glucose/arabinose dehydrogenase
MRFTLLAAVAVLALAACGGAETPATTAEAPATTEAPAASEPAATAGLTGPSAGLWRATAVADGTAAPPFEFCYKKQMTIEDAKAMQAEMGVTCSEETHNVTPGGMTSHAVCKMGDATVTTDTKMTGDFNSAYTVEIVSSTDAAAPTTVVTKMERVGDCPPGTP